jgi:uncharacterized protein YjbI with pentapeptide repeats
VLDENVMSNVLDENVMSNVLDENVTQNVNVNNANVNNTNVNDANVNNANVNEANVNGTNVNGTNVPDLDCQANAIHVGCESGSLNDDWSVTFNVATSTGGTFRAEIDTGAQCNVINARTVEKLQLANL